jgi:hypothetical protein
VKHDACLTHLTEVQVVPHDNVEKVVRRQCAVRWRLDVVAGDKELLPPIWGREDRSFRRFPALPNQSRSFTAPISPSSVTVAMGNSLTALCPFQGDPDLVGSPDRH